ncbi:hypothetical protein ABZ756_07045 [Mammaliicoccus sciuri]
MSNEELKEVKFKISGTDLNANSGYDLFYLSQSMELFHQLVEKTYLTLKDEKNMSKVKREDLKIRVFNIRPGSFEADFLIMIKGIVPSLLPMVTPLTAKTVWDTTKSSFEYLKTILKANEKGEKLHMDISNSENVNIINGNGSVIYVGHPDVIATAKETYPVFRKIANLVDEKEKTFEKAIFGDEFENEKTIEIGVEEKLLLQNKNVIEENPVEFKGRIFNADANKLSGKLEVLESEDIPLGEYSFEFIDKKNIKMLDYYDQDCNFSALKYSSFNPNTLEKTIVRLKLVSAYKES